MKRICLVTLLSVLAFMPTFAQSAKKGLARISKIQGVEVYAMCEPLRAYEVLFDVPTGGKAGSLLTGGVVNEGISDKLTQFVNRANKKAEREKKPYDAIVYTNGKSVIAVKWKEAATDSTKGLGRVQKLEGVEVYVMNEPLLDYENSVDVSTGLKAKSYLSGGVVNNSIEEDMAQYVRRAVKEAQEANKPLDAVVYSGGKRSIGVQFK